MKNRTLNRILAAALSLLIAAAYVPLSITDVCAESSIEAEASVDSESAEATGSQDNSEDDGEIIPEEEGAAAEAAAGEEENEMEPSDSERTVMQTGETGDDLFVIDEGIEHGRIEANADSATGVVSAKAIPDSGYELASVRVISGKGEDAAEAYIEFNEDDYSFSFNISDYENGTPVISATFYDLKVWDGAVDVSWYDPEKSSFDISTPAELAGLAAIVNGMVDSNVTREDQIRDPGRYVKEDGSIGHRHINTVKEYTRLIEQQGGGVEDEVYRLPAVRDKGILAEDDLYDDMRYRTINIRADIDMGDLNFTCIGGKHAMDTTPGTKDPKVIDTRFQGILDGHGHTVTISCNRHSPKGFAYSWNIGLVGYLGGGVDRVNSNAKDDRIDYAKENHPTVRNIVVRGSVLGRRCVGGVVGRIGETNYSCIVENCANYATVSSTDMRGCGGIVGAAWGNSVIRGCYNAGEITAQYGEVGGIVASNGYNYAGADIINCFNVGAVRIGNVSADGSVSNASYAGKEIGNDGEGGATYTVRNCLYLSPESSDSAKSGYVAGDNSKVFKDGLREVSSEELKSQASVDALNANGKAYALSTGGNSGYPVLYFEEGSHTGNCSVSVVKGENGSVTADGAEGAFEASVGTVLNLKASPSDGYRLGSFTVNGEAITGDFYVVTEDCTISADFVSVESASLIIPEHEGFTISVRRTYSGHSHEAVDEPLSTGDTVYKGDVIEVTGSIKKDAVPEDVDYEYSGRFSNATALDESTIEQLDREHLEVTGSGDVQIVLEPVIQKKDWVTIADTSWYVGHENDKTYEIGTARELAGMAKLICDGNDMGGTDFAGKTIRLTADIDLSNDDGTAGKRLWRTVGNPQDTFKGTFDGAGHTIRNMYVSFAVPVYGHVTGSHGGLFGVTDGATIKNLTITGDFWATAGDSGAFAGNAIDTTIENCVSDVTMLSAKQTGGIAGKAEGTTIIRNCTNKGDISGQSEIAGIVSNISTTSRFGGTNDVRIISCGNEGDISSTQLYAGGIAGHVNSKLLVSECINKGAIKASQNTVPDRTNGAVGGLIGTSEGFVTMERCTNRGSVTGEQYVDYAGGLIGYINYSAQSITSSYNTGSVEGGENTLAAGIASMTTGSKYAIPTITGCYNAGTVSSLKEGSSGLFLGSGNANNCSGNYCIRAEGSAEDGNVLGADLLSTDALKNGFTKLGSDYIPDTDDDNLGYPMLKWENPSVDISVPSVTIKSIARVSTTSCRISWTSASKADSYKLYRATASGGSYKLVATLPAGTSSYLNKGLTPGGDYYYKLSAVRDVHNGVLIDGALSSSKNIRLNLNKPAISGISNLKGRKVQLKWKKQSGATGYQIYYSTKKSSGYKRAKTLTSGSTVSYTKGSLSKNKTYYFKICTVSKRNGKTIYSAYSAVRSIKVRK